MIQYGNNLDYLAAFMGGILISFTPCIYPLIPVTAGFIGTETAGSKLKGFFLSLVYVSGIAVTYSILGLIATLTGTIFGKISSHPVTYLFVGAVIILFGFSMLGLFHIHLPWNKAKVSGHKKHDYFSTFFLGLSSGLVISPCLTPALSSILLYLSTKKNLFFGATLLLSFAYGMGFILILIGAFEGLLLNLPKSGNWMIWIKRIGAVILIAMGAYFIYTGIRRA